MVGVVGSSPIAPTKQNPLCWAVWKGSPKGGPFFVVRDLSRGFKTRTQSAKAPRITDLLQSRQAQMKSNSSRIELPATNCIKAGQASGLFVGSLRRESDDGEAGDDQVLCGVPVHLPFASMDDGRSVSLDSPPRAAAVDFVVAPLQVTVVPCYRDSGVI